MSMNLIYCSLSLLKRKDFSKLTFSNLNTSPNTNFLYFSISLNSLSSRLIWILSSTFLLLFFGFSSKVMKSECLINPVALISHVCIEVCAKNSVVCLMEGNHLTKKVEMKVSAGCDFSLKNGALKKRIPSVKSFLNTLKVKKLLGIEATTFLIPSHVPSKQHQTNV